MWLSDIFLLTLQINYVNIEIQMKGGTIIESIISVIVIMIIGYALYSDIRCFKVSNKVFVVGWSIAILSNVYFKGANGVYDWMLGCVCPVVVSIPIYLARGIGGADLKAFSVIGSFVGLNRCLTIIVLSFIFGAVISLLYLIARKEFIKQLLSCWHLIKAVISGRIFEGNHKVIALHKIHFMIPIWLALVTVIWIID